MSKTPFLRLSRPPKSLEPKIVAVMMALWILILVDSSIFLPIPSDW